MYVHPDLGPVLAALPERSMFGNIPRAREGLRRSRATRAPYDDPRLSIEDTAATGPDDSEVPVRLIWQMYLGADPAAAPPYAVPARATDLSGLPPIYLQVAGAEPLRDEGLAYARNLIDRQVAVELHFVPGAFHLFEDWAPTTDLARATVAHWTRALRDALAEK